MRQLLFVFLLLGAYASFAQRPETVKVARVLEIINQKSDKICIVNFWATWCAPCVKELPLFEKLNAEKKSEVDVYLVSMDLELDPNPEKVFRFVDRKKIESRVLLLDEKDPNTWIDKIDTDWSGALPATLIVNTKTGQRKFVEKELHEGDLEKLIAEVKGK